jgi:hypothetical protein
MKRTPKVTGAIEVGTTDVFARWYRTSPTTFHDESLRGGR